MNIDSVKLLIAKDFSLHEKKVAVYSLAILISTLIFGFKTEISVYAAFLVMVTLTVSAGFHCIAVSILTEKTEKTQPFIMSMPVTPIEYGVAKLAVNYIVFLIPWLAMLIGFIVAMKTFDLGFGMFVLAMLINVQLLVGFSLVVSIGLITETHSWTILTMVAVNLGLNPMINWLVRSEEINRYFQTNDIVWNQLSLTVLTIQILICILAVSFALFSQSRKRVFM